VMIFLIRSDLHGGGGGGGGGKGEEEEEERSVRVTDPTSRYYNDRAAYAMDSFAFYSCFKCKLPYFGGRRNCEQNADMENRPAAGTHKINCAVLKILILASIVAAVMFFFRFLFFFSFSSLSVSARPQSNSCWHQVSYQRSTLAHQSRLLNIALVFVCSCVMKIYVNGG
jgi:hypothetical protein